MIPQANGEGPARLARGTGRATLAIARAWKEPFKLNPRKYAQKLRMEAAGFDRRAGFLRDDGDMAGANAALAESARLRKLADDAEVTRYGTTSPI